MKGASKDKKNRNASNGEKTEGLSSAVKAAIRDLAAMIDETGLGEIEVEHDGARVRVARQAIAAIPTAAALQPQPNAAPQVTTTAATPHPGTVTSPMVGTAYLSPQPGATPFVKAGDKVKEGDTVLIIEAMKTMNPIAAPRSGTVIEILIRDGQPVEFGEPLLVVA